LAGRNQQQLVGALEGGGQTGRLVVIGLANLHTARRQIGNVLRMAHGGDDFASRQFLQQGFDDKAAQLAGGSGNDDHDQNSFISVSGVGRIATTLTFSKYAPEGKFQMHNDSTPRPGFAELMQRGQLFAEKCPSREVLKHVTSRWGVLLLVALLSGTQRFSDLRRKVNGIS